MWLVKVIYLQAWAVKNNPWCHIIWYNFFTNDNTDLHIKQYRPGQAMVVVWEGVVMGGGKHRKNIASNDIFSHRHTHTPGRRLGPLCGGTLWSPLRFAGSGSGRSFVEPVHPVHPASLAPDLAYTHTHTHTRRFLLSIFHTTTHNSNILIDCN